MTTMAELYKLNWYKVWVGNGLIYGGLPFGINLQYFYLDYKSGLQVFPGCVHLLAELNGCIALAQSAIK